ISSGKLSPVIPFIFIISPYPVRLENFFWEVIPCYSFYFYYFSLPG
ncbi:hypothetical protein Mgra_00009903, partial [Meloidogyne graminicola]